VVALLRANPKATDILVVVETTSGINPQYDAALAKARAASIVAYLRTSGLAERYSLEGTGLGSYCLTSPLQPNDTHVEILVLRFAGTSTSQQCGCAVSAQHGIHCGSDVDL